jgi:acetylornithine/succinyldiaminopimelate/putrescine aminotransferase
MKTYGRYPMTVSHGKGSKIYDFEGNEFLDMASGIATCCLGHAHPAMIKAVSEQMGRINHCSNLYFIPEQGKLAKWLIQHSCADKVSQQPPTFNIQARLSSSTVTYTMCDTICRLSFATLELKLMKAQ